MAVKIMINRNLANPSHGGLSLSGFVVFRFVAMLAASPSRLTPDVGSWFV